MNDEIVDRIRKEALIVTHPRHRQVLLDALDEIEGLRRFIAKVGDDVETDWVRRGGLAEEITSAVLATLQRGGDNLAILDAVRAAIGERRA